MVNNQIKIWIAQWIIPIIPFGEAQVVTSPSCKLLAPLMCHDQKREFTPILGDGHQFITLE